MTDELTPEQEAVVRRLLSGARHDGPVPADVAAHLDDVLDELAAGRARGDLPAVATAHSASVTELAVARRRRRNVGRLLLAAAAVVVGGVAVGQAIGNTGFQRADDDGGGDTAASAPRDNADGADSAEGAAGGAVEPGTPSGSKSEGLGGVPAPTAAEDQSLLKTLRAPVQLTSDSFAQDVRRELRRTGRARRVAAASDFDGVSLYAADRGFTCADASYGPGARVPAYYDAEEAVLVLRRPQAGIQRVDLLACGTAAPLNSVDLPAP